MNILTEKINKVVKLSLNGRLDASNVDVLKNHIKSAVEDGDNKFVLDMSAVDFVDSSGCGGIVASFRSVSQKGGDIRLAGLRPNVKHVFDLTRLHRLFDIFDDSNAAVKSYA